VIGPPGFPIDSAGLTGEWSFQAIADETLRVGGVTVTARHIRHRGPTLGFRVEAGGAVMAYLSDHGPGAEGRGTEHDGVVPDGVLDLVEGADLLVHDAQYTGEEYERLRHYGHCTPGYAVRVAAAGGVGTLALFHHDPGRDDAGVEEMVHLALASAEAEGYKGEIVAAAEGDAHVLGEARP
jgi:ribonuclease BN (tRNA processing enzyme)